MARMKTVDLALAASTLTSLVDLLPKPRNKHWMIIQIKTLSGYAPSVLLFVEGSTTTAYMELFQGDSMTFDKDHPIPDELYAYSNDGAKPSLVHVWIGDYD